MNKNKLGYIKKLSDQLSEVSAKLISNLEKISLLIDNEKVEEYVRLIEENEELIKEVSLIKEQLTVPELKNDDEKEGLLNKIELLSENSRSLNQINIEKLSQKVSQKGEENLIMSQKVHASRVYNDMQYDD